jgi:sugar lactone lactonase YvrE
MKKYIAAIAVLLLLGYLLFWPVPISPVAWQPPEAPALEGPYAINDKLADVSIIADGIGIGPEEVLLDEQGHLYTGYEDGRVMRFSKNGENADLIADTGGRPLGMALDAQGRLVVADAVKGLLRIDAGGRVETLATQANGVPFGFTNNVAIADNGLIYFSDASSKFGFAMKARDDVIEHGGHGRLMRLDPATGEIEVLLHGLQFANGVTLMPDQQSVLVAETGNYDIIRYWLAGERAGQQEVFIDNLPGLPDNIASDGEDTIWVALYAPRNAALDFMAPYPFLRKLAFRLPQSVQPQPAPHAFVLGLSTNGQVTHNLQHIGKDSYHPITGVFQHGDRLYLGSLTRDDMAWLDLSSMDRSAAPANN